MKLFVKKIGLSKFVVGFLGAFIVGIFFANIITINYFIDLIILVAILISIIIFWKNKNKLILLILISIFGLMLGLFYYHLWDFRENKKTLIYNENITIENCLVSNKPEVDSTTQKIIVSYHGTKILLTTNRYPEYKYGDVLKIAGIIKDPKSMSKSSDFDYGNYLLKKGIRGEIKNPEKVEKTGSGGNFFVKNIYRFGDIFEENLNRVLPEPQAAFSAGILLGVKRNIPDSLMTAFNRTGTTHIVAVSGYNLMAIVSALGLLLVPWSRKWAFWICFLAIIIFTILTGAVASVMRAAILATLVLWCKLLGRRPYYPTLILLVGSLMLLFNPYALKNDLSFQLSFLAFIGLVLISPKIAILPFVSKWPQIIKIPFSETMGAQIAVLPILLYSFGILSISAPLVNVLILQLVPGAMLMTFLAGLGAMINLQIGYLFAKITWLVLSYIIVVVEYFSKISFSAINLKTNEWWWIPIYYVIVILVTKNIKVDIKKDEIQ